MKICHLPTLCTTRTKSRTRYLKQGKNVLKRFETNKSFGNKFLIPFSVGFRTLGTPKKRSKSGLWNCKNLHLLLHCIISFCFLIVLRLGYKPFYLSCFLSYCRLVGLRKYSLRLVWKLLVLCRYSRIPIFCEVLYLTK